MASSELPSRDDFLANGLRVVESCSICLEPFGPAHVPVLFGSPDSCRHMFGNDCLQLWMSSLTENANKCPICRHLLFRNDDAEDDTGHDDIEGDTGTADPAGDMDYELYRLLTAAFGRDIAESNLSISELLAEEELPASVEQNETHSPTRLQDITDPRMAYDFVIVLSRKLITGIWFSDAQLLTCLEEVCLEFGIDTDLGFTRRQRTAMITLLHDLFREAPDEILWAEDTSDRKSRMSAIVGWRLEEYESE